MIQSIGSVLKRIEKTLNPSSESSSEATSLKPIPTPNKKIQVLFLLSKEDIQWFDDQILTIRERGITKVNRSSILHSIVDLFRKNEVHFGSIIEIDKAP